MQPWGFDINAMLALNFDGGAVMDAIMYVVSGRLTWIPLYGAVVAWVWYKWGWKNATLLLVCAAAMVLCADQTCNIFKMTIPKLRPSHNEEIAQMIHTVYGYKGGLFGTVSSHAANSAAFAIISSAIVKKKWYYVAIAVWTVAICYSRIYLGVHFPMDIVFGVFVGVIWGVVWYKVFKIAKKKFNI